MFGITLRRRHAAAKRSRRTHFAKAAGTIKIHGNYNTQITNCPWKNILFHGILPFFDKKAAGFGGDFTFCSRKFHLPQNHLTFLSIKNIIFIDIVP
jgi:hypothetical protein